MLVLCRQLLRFANRPQALDQHRAGRGREPHDLGEGSQGAEDWRVAARDNVVSIHRSS